MFNSHMQSSSDIALAEAIRSNVAPGELMAKTIEAVNAPPG
jgi:hypothetical protein